jgi:hypothetical protein
MFHTPFDVIVIVVLLAVGGEFHVTGLTVNVGAAWFTVTVRVMPPPVNVIVPLRKVVPVLAVAFIVN